jgi:2-polyprenyl-3-methyl-5-hydroxy-6-metoxy-1,4-benzoquinol methylase
LESCPLCGSRDWTLLYESTCDGPELDAADFRCTSDAYGVHGPIDRCNDCGLVFIADDTSAREIEAAYEQVEDNVYIAEKAGREATFARQLRKVEKRAPVKGRLLEVGSYTGVFLSQARDSGWDVTGIEPSAWAVDRAREKYGLELRQGPFVPGAVENGTYDVAVMWDVIEHLTDPVAIVRGLYDALKPGGLVAVSTMDIDSVPARVSKAKWPWLMSMHRVYFSRATMRRLLREVGFEKIETRAHVRRISVGYLGDRMAAALPAIGKGFEKGANALGAANAVVPFYMGDLFEAYAYKPAE